MQEGGGHFPALPCTALRHCLRHCLRQELQEEVLAEVRDVLRKGSRRGDTMQWYICSTRSVLHLRHQDNTSSRTELTISSMVPSTTKCSHFLCSLFTA